ncbi:alpha-ketoglutarate-dependent taurine dioxygenase [Erythrobacter sp. SD-21]|nr:alpha-ketoglutarate-dependent taurine dioxygenase [Erythrobacter sp. SD-21]
MITEPLAPHCGVEVRDVALAIAEGETLDAIRDLIYRHGVAVFRDQSFSPEEHIAFA